MEGGAEEGSHKRSGDRRGWSLETGGGGGWGVIMSSGLNCQNIRWNLPVLSSRASAIAVLREHALSGQLEFYGDVLLASPGPKADPSS